MTKTPSLDRLAFMLAMLSAIGPFAIDAYLPAFPQIAATLGATRLEVQQTLTIYMAALALMVLWHGALADRFGRRRVMLLLTAVFAVASLICALAPSIEWLWLGRALQGVSGGAGIVVGRAVVRDLHEGPQAQRLMSRVMLIFALAPALAPMVGAGLLALAGWRSIFVFLAAFGTFLCWMVWRFLPETLDADARQPLHPLGIRRVEPHRQHMPLALGRIAQHLAACVKPRRRFALCRGLRARLGGRQGAGGVSPPDRRSGRESGGRRGDPDDAAATAGPAGQSSADSVRLGTTG